MGLATTAIVPEPLCSARSKPSRSRVSVKDRAQGRIPAIVFSQSLLDKKPSNRSRGVEVVIMGKTRPAVLSAFKMVDLIGNGGIVFEVSPGVFLQMSNRSPL
ncbi:uncharacterized protein LOC107429854 isoform X2 [Ziziphus jujuba]|uniref:Uncharacterized protein LOC107429854 isoform X2 n=1 Tax=Ziziphus jujuba TaxID=326968 RepID=A0ABM3I3T7_ZIZJJ|nr:uncharacterized protein LOC107429854 isoform X2 [Ziziphus jujuba]